MDFLQMLENKDLISINNDYSYKSNFLVDKLFSTRKTDNLFAEAEMLTEGANIPVMAQVHALDTEARIGDRVGFEKIKLEKLFIKEKMNTTEKLMYYKNERGVSDSAIKDFIYNDINTLATRVMTRTSVMNGELLSTGKITIKENNVDLTVDYGMKSGNTIPATGWGAEDHNILADIEQVVTYAETQGYKIVRAITSTKVIGYMLNNKGIRANMNVNTTIDLFITKKELLSWLNDKFGIEFVVTDDVYKTEINGATKKIFKEDSISWLTTDGIVGDGLFGKTPEEMSLGSSTKGYVAITQYDTKDPVAIWTKASGIYLPVIRDINGLFISTIAE